MNLLKTVGRYLLIALALGIIVYLVTVISLLWLSAYNQPAIEKPAIITKTINYNRPPIVVKEVPQKKKTPRPDYTDVRLYYYDLQTNTYHVRQHKH